MSKRASTATTPNEIAIEYDRMIREANKARARAKAEAKAWREAAISATRDPLQRVLIAALPLAGVPELRHSPRCYDMVGGCPLCDARDTLWDAIDYAEDATYDSAAAICGYCRAGFHDNCLMDRLVEATRVYRECRCDVPAHKKRKQA